LRDEKGKLRDENAATITFAAAAETKADVTVAAVAT
jgi:hypothetical protein